LGSLLMRSMISIRISSCLVSSACAMLKPSFEYVFAFFCGSKISS
jgi:hypothetical protein